MIDKSDPQSSSTEDTCPSEFDPRGFAEGGTQHSVVDIHDIHGIHGA